MRPPNKPMCRRVTAQADMLWPEHPHNGSIHVDRLSDRDAHEELTIMLCVMSQAWFCFPGLLSPRH